MIMFVDSHTHLDMPHFDTDRDAVIARAREASVAAILTLGVDRASSQRAVTLAQRTRSVCRRGHSSTRGQACHARGL